MRISDPPVGPAEEFRNALVAAEILIPTGVDGLFGRSALYEGIASGVRRMVHELPDGAGSTELSFPPVMARHIFEQTGYLDSFPHLIGAVQSFQGTDREHAGLMRAALAGEDWSGRLSPTEVVLCPAACHPLYPTCAGPLPVGGKRFEVTGYCFRHEPSLDPSRMQAFRQQEFVYLGEPETASSRHERWAVVALQALAELGLELRAEPANDPFFGRAAELLAERQRSGGQKIEIVASLPAWGGMAAVASCNLHLDHFGGQFGIETAEGAVAHSSCVGFGLDRITVALLATHGLDPARWPPSAHDRLWP